METEQDAIGPELTRNGALQGSGFSGTPTDRHDVLASTESTRGTPTSPEERPGELNIRMPTLSKSPDAEASSEQKKNPLQRAANATIPSDIDVADAPTEEERKMEDLNAVPDLKLSKDVTNEENTDSASQPIQTPTPVAVKVEGPVASEGFEEFINSPRGQNAIVERSPEGRYVRFMEKLGSGASKDVYRAYDTTEGIEVAWNVVQLTGVPKPERNRIVNEVRLLERLHHPNIISFHGSWVNRERQEVNFVTEILSSGTLTSFIEKVQVIRWKIAKRWAIQILKGLEYLHSQDPPVIHRDLKCENIFINGTSGDLRIGDLGLSTVHRNGKVLSVLGTPEFMAPDLYEESAYDEKVDVYAFGMCLLEILTKEIPYRECSNPAQIYKKVMSGEKPDSLNRLKSKMARDFIVLCLGVKDPVTGKYDRPSVTELLTHQFLAKSADDDSEVIVDVPLQRRTIAEDPGTTKSQGTASSADDRTVEEQVPLPTSRRKGESHEVDDSDKFEEMPDSESNIRKVKVLMGRNKELNEENHVTTKHGSPLQPEMNDTESAAPAAPAHLQPFLDNVTPPSAQNILGPVSDDQSNQSPPGQQLIFAANVIEDQAAAMPHYQDELLKLIITLHVQGQTQNVQFPFHLVEDDPVEVAKEMVADLGIPQDAVLEIGGTISALARQARIKQGHYRRQQQVVQGNPPASVPLVMLPEPLAHSQAYPLQNTVQGLQTMQAAGTPGQPGAVVPTPVPPPNVRPTAVPLVSPSLALPNHLSQVNALEQVPGMYQLSNPSSTNASPVALLIPRKIAASPDQTASELTSQDQPSHVTESSAIRALGSSIGAVTNVSEDDEEDSVSEELRRLDEDFQKNVIRAQKVFDSRMDNLQRSKLEKEELHKKTLQKHEKERIEFEKRLQQEEIEQSQRLEKMQREWEMQRQILEQAKRKHTTTTPGESLAHQGLVQGTGTGTHPISRSPSQESMVQNISQQRDD